MKRVLYFICILCSAFCVLTACQKGEVPVIYPDGSDTLQRDANSIVVYECNERLFASSDAFKAIEAYVPTLKNMGVNVLWLMPIHPIGELKAVGSPYCVKDYKAIHPDFGTMEDLKSLVKTCHANGMLVMLDWIANHTAWDHAWTTEHPDWYQEAQNPDEKGWADVTFLNFNKAEVRAAMKDAMLYWVNEADIDGYRCDYATGVPVDFWQDVNEAIKAKKANALLLAETSDTRYYDAGFDWLYSWEFLYGVEGVYQGSKTLSSLFTTNKSEYNITPADKERLRYITTHDETATKAPQTVYRTAQGELSAMCLTIFVGGVPMIYSSQELGYMNKINFFEYNILDFASQNNTRDALSQLMRIYHATANYRSGKQITGSLSATVPYVEFEANDGTLLVICNTTPNENTVKFPMKHQGKEVTNLLTNTQETLGKTTTLAPYEYRIYTSK